MREQNLPKETSTGDYWCIINDTGQYLGGLVREQSVLSRVLSISAGLELGQIAVVVTLHLQVKDLGLAGRGCWNEMVIQKLQDAGTYVAELLFHLCASHIRSHTEVRTYPVEENERLGPM